MPPKKMKEVEPSVEVVEEVEEMPKKKKGAKKEKVDEVEKVEVPKKKGGGGMRKMDEKEKELLKKYFAENSSDKSAQAKLRMKVMRNAKSISTMGQLKKLV